MCGLDSARSQEPVIQLVGETALPPGAEKAARTATCNNYAGDQAEGSQPPGTPEPVGRIAVETREQGDGKGTAVPPLLR